MFFLHLIHLSGPIFLSVQRREKTSGIIPTLCCHKTPEYCSLEQFLLNENGGGGEQISLKRPSLYYSFLQCQLCYQGALGWESKCLLSQGCTILLVCVNFNPQLQINHTQRNTAIQSKITKEQSKVDHGLCLGSLVFYQHLQLSLKSVSKAPLLDQELFCLVLWKKMQYMSIL